MHQPIKKKYGRKNGPSLFQNPGKGKRRESNITISSFFFSPKRTASNLIFSPFKNLKKYIYLHAPPSFATDYPSNASPFDVIPDTSPIQINALHPIKKRTKPLVASQLSMKIKTSEDEKGGNSIQSVGGGLPILATAGVNKENYFEINKNGHLKNYTAAMAADEENPFLDFGKKEGHPIITSSIPQSVLTRPVTQSVAQLEEVDKGGNVLILDLLLRACDQDQVLNFTDFMTEFRDHYYIEKVGESSYSEVFKCSPIDYQTTGNLMALKIIPIDMDVGQHVDENKDEDMPYRSRSRDVLHELLITQTLSPKDTNPPLLNGFIRLFGAALVSGSFPSILIDSWNSWRDQVGTENLSPDLLDQIPSQHYMILLLEYGGSELESFQFDSLAQVKSLFFQLLLALYSAQKNFAFEHRDLHLGNILIQKVALGESSLIIPEEFRGMSVDLAELRVSIIDYSLSRMRPGIIMCIFFIEVDEDGILYADLELDPEIFNGDINVDIQYEVYRKMRSLLGYPANSHPNWETFVPATNILWLQYISDRILKGLSFRRKLPQAKRLLSSISTYCSSNISPDGLGFGFVFNLLELIVNC